jgi:hypothetical protein
MHAYVSEINRDLKKRGLKTWFDEERMEGVIQTAMTKGIDRSKAVLVCVSNLYCKKVAGDNATDNCQKEFLYADKQKKGVKGMIAVVVEDGMQDTSLWKGTVGFTLGSGLYVDLSPSVTGQAREKALDEICKRVKSM